MPWRTTFHVWVPAGVGIAAALASLRNGRPRATSQATWVVEWLVDGVRLYHSSRSSSPNWAFAVGADVAGSLSQ